MNLVEKYLGEARQTMYWKKKGDKKFKKVVQGNNFTDIEILKYQSQLAMDNQIGKGAVNIIVVDDSSDKVLAHEFNLPGMKHPSYEKELAKVKKVVNKAGFKMD